MLNINLEKALNRQVNREMYSAYLYLSMAAYLESRKLPGFSNWMKVQAREEMTHAMRIFDYIHDQGARVTLDAIEAPPPEWADPTAVALNVYEHEQAVTAMIKDIAMMAEKENDQNTRNMLQWFLDEQEEEEESAEELLEKARRAGGLVGGYGELDRELAQREFHPPGSQKKPNIT
ncbi:ferritin [bacterium]|nr:ferritin [bacterium]